MDGTSFDRIARALGAGLTRRSGLLGAFGALAGVGLGAGLPAIESIDAKGSGKDNGKGKDGPGIAGPCGKGVKKNSCKQNSDCCTNICKTKIKTKDKMGRCRCEKKGRPCSEDRNCCGKISCVAGKCGGTEPMVATGDACTASSVCRDPNAECTTYEFGTPAGTYCLLPVQGLCSTASECVSSRCTNGSCRPCSVAACVESCTPTVCATCTHTTVQAAIDAATDGDVIAIGKGTWIENLAISKALTLRACPGDRVTLRNASYGNRTITVTGGKSLTVLDIIVDGYEDHANSNNGGGIKSNGSLTLAGTTVVKNGGWSGSNYGGGVDVQGDGLTVTVTDDVVIRDSWAGWGGGGIHVQGQSEFLISGWVVISGNYSDSYGGGMLVDDGANLTLSGHARITGNSATSGYGGGGVSVFADNATRASTVTLKDDVVIADNRLGGPGGGIDVSGNSSALVTVLITDRVRITGNTSDSYGGGMVLEEWAVATISGDVEISGNSAPDGGGILGIWVANDQPAGLVQLTITDSVRVVDNSATTIAGGGITLNRVAAEISGSVVISGNTAVKGGGVYLSDAPASLTVSGNATITGNTATDSSPSGGGVYSKDNANTLTVNGGSISGNTPDQCAGGTISC